MIFYYILHTDTIYFTAKTILSQHYPSLIQKVFTVISFHVVIIASNFSFHILVKNQYFIVKIPIILYIYF